MLVHIFLRQESQSNVLVCLPAASLGWNWVPLFPQMTHCWSFSFSCSLVVACLGMMLLLCDWQLDSVAANCGPSLTNTWVFSVPPGALRDIESTFLLVASNNAAVQETPMAFLFVGAN